MVSSQPQNPEFRNNPENFTHALCGMSSGSILFSKEPVYRGFSILNKWSIM